jgi:5-deoxy-glucuronate isomerase
VSASELLVRGAASGTGGGTVVEVTPQTAGWSYVGFEAVRIAPGEALERRFAGRETCVVVIEGGCHVSSEHVEWRDLGGRGSPFDGRADAAYLPPGTPFEIESAGAVAEVGICTGPAAAGAPARVLRGSAVEPEIRGHGALERVVHPILMDDEPADSLLVCEVLTPAGHWSSYPPHKHDRDAMPAESLLEETYYHRVDPPRGFGLQRVYSDDRDLDETVAFGDRDVVLVPRGYHTVSAPPGYRLYYLNVMAGPVRAWAVANDPDHEWTLQPASAG